MSDLESLPRPTRELSEQGRQALRRRWRLAPFLPGALAGALLGSLLFFLNPDVYFSFWTVVRTVFYFGALFGVAALILYLPLSGSRRLPVWRLLPWFVTCVLGLAALMYWVNASYYSFYLAPGVGIRLIKTALWLSLASLISFYTTLLHTLQSRPYGLGSRALLVSLAIAGVGISIDQRAGLRLPAERIARPPAVGRAAEAPRLVVVGIETASLDAILPLAEQGQLPFLANLLQQGAYGRLETLAPVRRLPLWFSLMTGKHPFRHGIVDQSGLEAFPAASDSVWHLLPAVLGLSRWGPLVGLDRVRNTPPSPSAPALWQFLERAGVSTAVIGWPAPNDSLALCDIALTETYFRTLRATPFDTADALDTVRDNVITPDSMDRALFTRLGGEAPEDLADNLSLDLWQEAVARDVLRSERTQALFLGLPGLAEVSRRYFGGYVETQFQGNRGADVEAATRSVVGYYTLIDEALQRIWQSLEGRRLMVIVSAWGSDDSGPWQRISSSATGRRSTAGRFGTAPDGIFMLLGDNLNSGTFLDRVQLADVTPTLLYALGLPLVRDFDGTVLTRSFGANFLNRRPLTFVP